MILLPSHHLATLGCACGTGGVVPRECVLQRPTRPMRAVWLRIGAFLPHGGPAGRKFLVKRRPAVGPGLLEA
jgi:hypothetical protein